MGIGVREQRKQKEYTRKTGARRNYLKSPRTTKWMPLILDRVTNRMSQGRFIYLENIVRDMPYDFEPGIYKVYWSAKAKRYLALPLLAQLEEESDWIFKRTVILR